MEIIAYALQLSPITIMADVISVLLGRGISMELVAPMGAIIYRQLVVVAQVLIHTIIIREGLAGTDAQAAQAPQTPDLSVFRIRILISVRPAILLVEIGMTAVSVTTIMTVVGNILIITDPGRGLSLPVATPTGDILPVWIIIGKLARM